MNTFNNLFFLSNVGRSAQADFIEALARSEALTIENTEKIRKFEPAIKPIGANGSDIKQLVNQRTNFNATPIEVKEEEEEEEEVDDRSNSTEPNDDAYHSFDDLDDADDDIEIHVAQMEEEEVEEEDS